MARTIPQILGLTAALVIAVPAAFLGVDMLVDGRPLGLAFLGVGAAVLLFEEYAVSPTDLPGKVASRAVGRIVKTGEED